MLFIHKKHCEPLKSIEKLDFDAGIPSFKQYLILTLLENTKTLFLKQPLICFPSTADHNHLSD